MGTVMIEIVLPAFTPGFRRLVWRYRSARHAGDTGDKTTTE